MSKLAPDTDPEFAVFPADDMRCYNEARGGCIEIEFRGAIILAPRDGIVKAVDFICEELRAKDRKAYARAVSRAIDKVWADVAAKRATTDVAIACCEDISILYAMKVFNGTVALPPAPSTRLNDSGMFAWLKLEPLH